MRDLTIKAVLDRVPFLLAPNDICNGSRNVFCGDRRRKHSSRQYLLYNFNGIERCSEVRTWYNWSTFTCYIDTLRRSDFKLGAKPIIYRLFLQHAKPIFLQQEIRNFSHARWQKSCRGAAQGIPSEGSLSHICGPSGDLVHWAWFFGRGRGLSYRDFLLRPEIMARIFLSRKPSLE